MIDTIQHQTNRPAFRCAFLTLTILLTCVLSTAAEPASSAKATPWTHQDYPDTAQDFHFSVVSDNAANPRPGVFQAALVKLQLLRPDLVLSVGDFIHGYGAQMKPLTSEEVIRAKRDSFDKLLKTLTMPFYRVAGNHDINNDVSARIWKQRYGPDYYAFEYGNVLFICLNSQDGKDFRPGIGPAQLAWAKKTLAKHSNVRWTCLFLHQPLWLEDEKRLKNAQDKDEPARLTGFDKVETLLEGRDHTVFAGHHHRYGKWVKHGNTYFRLATTGGQSALGGPEAGQFDHVMWITMTDKGPVICNLLLKGVLDEDAKSNMPEMLIESK